jgi:hypothetical protein
MFEFALVIFAVLFFFLINTLYALFVAPIISMKVMTKTLGLYEDDDWTGDHTDSALNLDKNH